MYITFYTYYVHIIKSYLTAMIYVNLSIYFVILPVNIHMYLIVRKMGSLKGEVFIWVIFFKPPLPRKCLNVRHCIMALCL